MDKLIPIDASEFKKPHWIANLGNYNKMPTPFREITEEEFYLTFGQYTPGYWEYRQVENLSDKRQYRSVHMFWYYNTCLVIAPPVYDAPLKYYACGCEHQYLELSPIQCQAEGLYHGGRCYHVTRCSQCGHVRSYDSSD